MALSNRLILFILFILAFLVWLFPGGSPAGAQAQWEICQNGETITSCTTYDCPLGDTNGDGKCTLDDESGRITSARQDALCMSPTSGCGQIHYFSQTSSNSCNVKVSENAQNCNLYSVANPAFTPAPTISPTPAPTTPPISTETKGGAQEVEELPETGSEIFGILALVVIGFAGIFIHERFKLD